MNISLQEISGNQRSTSEYIGLAVHGSSLKLEDYLLEDLYARLGHIAHLSSFLRDLDESHCHTLVEPICSNKYHLIRGMVTACLSSIFNLDDAIYATTLHIVESMTFLKDGCCTFMLYGCHQLITVKI